MNKSFSDKLKAGWSREQLMKYYCLSDKKSDHEYSGGYFTMIKSSIDLKYFTTRESSE